MTTLNWKQTYLKLECYENKIETFVVAMVISILTTFSKTYLYKHSLNLSWISVLPSSGPLPITVEMLKNVLSLIYGKLADFTIDGESHIWCVIFLNYILWQII